MRPSSGVCLVQLALPSLGGGGRRGSGLLLPPLPHGFCVGGQKGGEGEGAGEGEGEGEEDEAVVAGAPFVAGGAWGPPLAPASEQDQDTLAAQGGHVLGLVLIVPEEEEEEEEEDGSQNFFLTFLWCADTAMWAWLRTRSPCSSTHVFTSSSTWWVCGFAL